MSSCMLVGTNCSECVNTLDPNEPCSSKETIKHLSDFIVSKGNKKNTDSIENGENILPKSKSLESKIVNKAANILGCVSESCVLTHPDITEFIIDKVGSKRVVDRDLDTRFKEKGPRDTTLWTNNYNLDGTLKRWADEFETFYPYTFCMMDFFHTNGSLVSIKPKQWLSNGKNCAGCVLNTDVSTGSGIHWVAIFVDCRYDPITIEYFNSSGNPPPKPVIKWMEDTKKQIKEYYSQNNDIDVVTIPVSKIQHQFSESECGLYALFYIRKRCEGSSYKEFSKTPIKDNCMIAFRKHVFRRH